MKMGFLLKGGLGRFYEKAKWAAWSHPVLYLPMCMIRKRPSPLNHQYDIMMDGYPRSANTYLLRMFQATQGDRLVIRSHNHAPPYLIEAVRAAKPVCLTLRDPRECVLSWVVISGRSVRAGLVYYVNFHRMLLPYLPSMVVSPFEVTSNDCKQVFSCLAARFGCDLNLDFDESEVRKKVTGEMAGETRSDALVERGPSLPSIQREEIKRRLADDLQMAEHQDLLAEALRLHEICASSPGAIKEAVAANPQPSHKY